jgi:TldD protein
VLLDKNLLEEVLGTLISTGADYAEVFVQRSSFTTMSRKDGKTGQINGGEMQGVGIRLVADDVTCFASISGLDRKDLVDEATRLARSFSWGPRCTLAPLEVQPSRHLNLSLVPHDVVPFQWKEAQLVSGESAALNMDDRVGAYYGLYTDSSSEVLVANSLGALVEETRSYVTLYQQVRTRKNGRSFVGAQVRSAASGYELAKDVGPKAAAGEAVRTALFQLEARPAPSGVLPVVLAPRASGFFVHETVGRCLEGDLVAGRLSPYWKSRGERVAPPGFNLCDDGAAPGKRGTSDYDDEGTPTSRATLIEGGVLRGFLLDRISAKKLNLLPSGHGRRESFRYMPSPRMRNLQVQAGPFSRQELVEGVDFGLYVVQMGGGNVDAASGDFVFDVTEGYLIRGGKIAEPVRGGRVSGNVLSALLAVNGIGGDVGYSVGTCVKSGQRVPVSDSVPSLRMQRLDLIGAG